MRWKRCILVMMFWLPVCLQPAAGAEMFENVTETRLENGLKLILMENHTAPVITFQVWYHAGARKEQWGKTGLAHVFEHMMFKGTKEYSGEEYSRLITANGGNYNAFTSYDFAGYYENLMADRIEIAIELEADRMANLDFPRQEFQTEVQVVMEERRMRVADDPQAYLLEQVQATAFQAQPYHWPIIGWIDDLKRLTVEDARRYYDQYYCPANAVIVTVGDFETKEMIADIEKWFGPLESGEPPPVIKYNDPPQRGERRVNVNTFAELPYVVIGYHVPNLENPDAYVLEVIAAILSAGKSSRLYRELVLEKELALSASAQNPLVSIDPDLFYLSAQPLPGKAPDALEEELMGQVRRLQSEPVDPEELEKAVNQLETGFIYSQDSLFYQAMLLARYEIVTEWQDIRDYIPAVRRVSPDDIMRVAQKYLKQEKATVGILYPEKADNAQKPAQTPQTPGESK